MADENLRDLERRARDGTAVDAERFLQALVRSGKANETLVALVDAWRKCRSPEIAVAVERLAARFEHETLEARTRSALHELWLAKAKDATTLDLGVLLPLLTHGTHDQVAEKLDAAKAWAADPRLTSTLLRFTETPRFNEYSQKAWRRVFALLGTLGDSRALERLAALAPASRTRTGSSLREQFVARAAKTAEALRNRPATPGSKETLELARALGNLGEAPALEPSQRALEAVYDDPFDPEKRVAFGKSLPEGDPRRELIELQDRARAGTLDAKGAVRVRALAKKHGASWTGLPEDVVRAPLELELGFPSTVRLGRLVEAVPACATIRTLWIPRDNEAVALFVTSPHLKSLTTLITESRSALLALAPTSKIEALQFERTIVTGWTYGRSNEIDAEVVEAFEALSKLKRLSLPKPAWEESAKPDGRFDRLLSGPMFQRLEHFEVGALDATLEAWLVAIEPLSPRTFSTWMWQEPFGATWLRPAHWMFTFSRGESGTFSRLRAVIAKGLDAKPLLGVLRELDPARLEKLEVVAKKLVPSVAEDIAKAAKRHARLAAPSFSTGGPRGR